MCTQSSIVFNQLDDLGVQYEVIHHTAVYTIEEMERLKLPYVDVCKNLFLRDSKGRRHFLVTMSKDKKADLKSIQNQIGCTNLSFASEKRLHKYLKLNKGEVTPFGILNDKDCSVEVVFDMDLMDKSKLGVHPNDNKATVWISFIDLRKVVELNGNIIHFVKI